MIRFTENALIRLRNSLPQNLGRYLSAVSWAREWLRDDVGMDMFEASAGAPEVQLNLICDPGREEHEDDLENAIRLYEALPEIPLNLASDERFWAYLTHVTCWDYMTKRWSPTTQGIVKERYFLAHGSDRGALRNGIARLWWMAQATYDPDRADPFELTRILLLSEDVAQQTLERSLSRARRVTTAFLEGLREATEGKPPRGRSHRRALEEINRMGAVRLLEAVPSDEIRAVVREIVSSAAEAASGDEAGDGAGGAWPLKIELIPKPLFERNFRNAEPEVWKRVSREVREAARDRCAVCGQQADRLECDEVWEYDEESAEATLVDLRAICVKCHQVKHMGRTQKLADQGDLDMSAVVAHFLETNKCTQEDYESHYRQAWIDWHRRNEITGWVVNYGRWRIS